MHFELSKDKNVDIIGEFKTQVAIFTKLMGQGSDHFDSHKIRPKDITGLKDLLETYSKDHKMPIRDWGHANLIDKFFGLNLEGTGTLDVNKITPQALIKTLDENLIEGYNELMCHAGYVDNELRAISGYNNPREIELNSLLSTDFKQYLAESKNIELISWKKVKL